MIPREAPWPHVHGGHDARRPWPISDAALAATSPPYLWKAKYSDDLDEWGAGTLDQYLQDNVQLAESAWAAVRPGGWFALNVGDTRVNTGGAGEQVTKTGQRVYRQDRSHGIEGRQWANAPHNAAERIRRETGWRFTGDVVWRKPTPILADCSAYQLARNRRPGLQHESVFLFWKPGGDQTWNGEALTEARDPYAVAAAEWVERVKAAEKALPPSERKRLRGLGLLPTPDERAAILRLAAPGTRAVLGSVWDLPKHTSEPPWSDTKDDTKAWPDALCERLVLLLTNPGDLVVDPCGGYGSLGRAAMHHGRRQWCADLFTGTVEATLPEGTQLRPLSA